MNKKKIVLLIVIVLTLGIGIYIFISHDDNDAFDKTKYAQIYLYDLGNSNVEIIKKDDYVILVNTGVREDRDNLLDYLDKLGIDRIDYLILTNKDEASLGNAAFIVNGLQVQYIYLNDYEYSSKNLEELNEVLQDNYATPFVLTTYENIKLGDLNIDIYPYFEEKYSMEDKTLVVKVKEGDKAIFLLNNASVKRFKDVTDSYVLASQNENLYDIKSKYYIYDGSKKMKNNKNVLKRNVQIYVNNEEFIIK